MSKRNAFWVFSLEDVEGNPAREMDSNFPELCPAFQFPLYCPLLLTSLSARCFNCFSIHLSFLISPCFSVSSPPSPFQWCILLTNFHYFTASPNMSSFCSLHLATNPLLWHISCLCSWQALQEKTTGSSETMLL